MNLLLQAAKYVEDYRIIIFNFVLIFFCFNKKQTHFPSIESDENVKIRENSEKIRGPPGVH